jgi:benzoylformate decarboxylase
MDDWGEETDAALVIDRTVTGRAAADVTDLAARIDAARRPAFVAGPDIDAGGGWDAAIALVERAHMDAWATPAPGGGRLGFPESHPQYRGVLAPAIGPAGQMLAEYDLVVVAGSSVFPYYPYMAGPALAEGTTLVAITSDPDEAARAPAGDAIVGGVAHTLTALSIAVSKSDRELPPPLEDPPPAEPGTAAEVMTAVNELLPDDGVIVLESPSSTMALRNRLRISRPGSYYFGAGGGLGFGLSAALGVQLALPDRRVVCVLGEGSAQYAVSGFWTAVAYDLPLTFLVLRNREYAILKWFADLEQVTGAPGLDLPALDTAAIASGYGVPSKRVTELEELRAELSGAIAADGPRLVEVDVAPGMSLF